MRPHHSLVFFHVLFEVPLVVVVSQQLALVEREVALAEGEVVLVSFAHVAHHDRVARGCILESFSRPPPRVGARDILHFARLEVAHGPVLLQRTKMSTFPDLLFFMRQSYYNMYIRTCPATRQ